jgi:hypothetical protein
VFLHLITICIGLIIAFGLQQIVELFQRRRLRKQCALQQQAAEPIAEDIEPPPPTSQT